MREEDDVFRQLKVAHLGGDVFQVFGTGWEPGEVYFGPDGVQGADAAPPKYTTARKDGRFEVTIRDVTAARYVFWAAGDSAVESVDVG